VGKATKPRLAVVFLAMLTLGVSLVLPAEDVLEAIYDESEALPFEGVPLCSIVVPSAAARTSQSVLSSIDIKPSAPSLFASARVHDTDANRPANTRISLALLCTLLC
jgi:hypothetical protein